MPDQLIYRRVTEDKGIVVTLDTVDGELTTFLTMDQARADLEALRDCITRLQFEKPVSMLANFIDWIADDLEKMMTKDRELSDD
jgi:hypothetical protein